MLFNVELEVRLPRWIKNFLFDSVRTPYLILESSQVQIAFTSWKTFSAPRAAFLVAWIPDKYCALLPNYLRGKNPRKFLYFSIAAPLQCSTQIEVSSQSRQQNAFAKAIKRPSPFACILNFPFSLDFTRYTSLKTEIIANFSNKEKESSYFVLFQTGIEAGTIRNEKRM